MISFLKTHAFLFNGMYDYFVYVLHCVGNPKHYYYHGYTNDLKKCYLNHKRGANNLTKKFNGNLSIEYVELIQARTRELSRELALHREQQLKKYNKRKKKQVIKLHEEKTAQILSTHLF